MIPPPHPLLYAPLHAQRLHLANQANKLPSKPLNVAKNSGNAAAGAP